MSRKGLRAAVIGLGKMGLLHASILNTLSDVQLTALCDKSTLIRRFCRKAAPQVEMVDDLERLSELDLDIVYVTTPIPSHFDVIKTIYSKRIADNIFVEKTLASSYKESKEICESATTSKGARMVGYMKRFGVTFRKARNLLNQETLGELASFEGYAYSSDFSSMKDDSTIPISRGGVLRDLGAHIIDMALWFFGELDVVSTSPERPMEGGSVNFRTTGNDNVEGYFRVSARMREYRLPEFGLTIVGSEGVMKVNDDRVELKRDGRVSKWYRHDLDDNVDFLLGAPEYFRENEHFVRSILGDVNPEPSFHSGARVDYVIHQVENRVGKHA